MAKVATEQFFVNQKPRAFEIHYSPRDENFFVKLPPAFEQETGKTSKADTLRKAIELARDIIRAYEQSKATRRKVLMVYMPEKESFSRLSYSCFDMRVFELSLSYRIAEEVTVDGEKKLIDDRGRAQHIASDDIAIIEWTQEREDFFANAVKTLCAAKDKIRALIVSAEQNPALIDNRGTLFQLTEGIPDGSTPEAGNKPETNDMNTIAITPIENSSQINGIGYQPETKTLAVQFHKRTKGQPPQPGSVYHYADVPPETFAEFKAAESKGSFFGQRIKGVFQFTKQEESAAQ